MKESMKNLISSKIFKSVQAITLFLLAFGSINFLFIKIVTIENYIACLLAFGIGTILSILLFKKIFNNLIEETKKYEFLLLLVPIILHGITCYYCLHFLNEPIGPFENTGTSFLLLENFFIWVKPFDVLYQQIILIILIKKLHQYKITLRSITIMFVFVFGASHIFQVFKTDFVIGLGFLLFGLAGSFIFPFMILKVKNGYLYNFIIHLLVYDLAALLFWSFY